MKSVLLMRHASAVHGGADHERPLSSFGRRQSEQVGRLLLRRNRVPQRILSSSAVRAVSTAEIAGRACGFAGAVRVEPRLYLGDPTVYLELLSALDDDAASALLVGHNPAIGHLLFALSGRVESMATATIAPVDLEIERWRDLHQARRGELRALLGVDSPGGD